jgi:DNA-binding response OmpR family regulator
MPYNARVTQSWGAAIVLMEDDANDAFFFRDALQKASIINPVLCFETAKQARRHFAETKQFVLPALFVLDVNLAGGETGIEFLRWLRQQRAPLGSTPTMMLTGSDRPADRAEAELLGSIDFLRKPVSEDTVVAAIQSLGFLLKTPIGYTAERAIERRL